MKSINVFLIIYFVFSFPLFSQDRTGWFEFYLPWDDSTESVTNMSAYLDPPAGKHGFLQVTPAGHFRFQNSEEDVRFAGVVNVAVSNFPDKATAPVLAARMAKYGINLVRIHLIDVEWQYGLFENSAVNTLELSSDRLDRMDYFIHCMKEKGIYFNFCIHAGRIFREADGIGAPINNKQSKYVTLFDEKLIELEKQFANQTLGHLNPYTGMAYADDPAMANLELTNENQLFNGWFGWNRDYLFAQTEEGIGPYYAAELDTLFNQWLAERYPDNDSLVKAWSGEKASSTELVSNQSFEDGLSGWSTYVREANGAVASITADENEAADGSRSARFSITSPGTASWHIQMKTNNFAVQKNQGYKVAFYAKSDSEDNFGFQVMENDTWKWIANPIYHAGENWQLIEYYFTSPFDSPKLIIQFDFGLATGNFWIDSVSVTRSGGVGLEDGESVLLKNVKRVPHSQIGKYSNRRVADNARFYFDLEGRYIEVMMDYLKNDLGVKVPVTFTNNYFGLASIYSQSRADYMDTHSYWDHPNYPNGWSDTDFIMHNRPMVKDPSGSTINRLSFSRVEGMPLVLSEYNHPYPQIYQAEAPSLLYAYGSYLDLDGIIWHAYYDYSGRYSQRYQDMFFDISMHPVMMTQMLLSIPYKLGYIAPATNKVIAHYNEQELFDNTKYYQDENVINIKDVDYGTSFLKDLFAHASFNADSNYLAGNFSDPEGIIYSDEQQLAWDGNRGIVKINNPYWQGATGFLGEESLVFDDIVLSEISTTNQLNFAYVHLLALDSLPIKESGKLVLLTGARLENEGFLWNDDQTTPVDIGGTRALCEPVQGKISLKFPSRDSFYVFRLDERGLRSETVFESDSSGNWSIEFDHKTLWYEILNDSARAEIIIDTTVIDTTVVDTTTVDTTYILHSETSDIRSYPNPCRNHLMIYLSDVGNSEGKLIIYNSSGRYVREKNIVLPHRKRNLLEIDISDLTNGIYFCKFISKQGISSMDKFVKLN
ncbi:MAG: carbohydrate binding domain-containing protein [Bacteroidales bacterium]|nr:carbohydrate binding domain-containing protein [Bacteroidales bacterium]